MTSSNSSIRKPDEQALSGLERRCLDLISKGAKIARVAETLNITEREVEILLFYVRRRLGATSTMQAIAMCIADGTLPFTDGQSANH